jgi:hypothetical protein
VNVVHNFIGGGWLILIRDHTQVVILEKLEQNSNQIQGLCGSFKHGLDYMPVYQKMAICHCSLKKNELSGLLLYISCIISGLC